MPLINVSVSDTIRTEPIPGKELRETFSDGIVTTFLVEPVDLCVARVTIATAYTKDGLRGCRTSLLPAYHSAPAAAP